jgi:nicotinamidase-related amidase
MMHRYRHSGYAAILSDKRGQMMKVALLVVDVQKAMFHEKPYHAEELLANISTLLGVARENGVESIYIRHNSRKGGVMEPETDGWQIHDEIAPIPNEAIFDKNFNSAFKETKLHQYVQTKEVDTLIIVGLQTEYCIDTTCRVSFELRYRNIIPKGCNSTYANGIIDAEKIIQHHNAMIFDGRFGKVIDLDDVIKQYMKT